MERIKLLVFAGREFYPSGGFNDFFVHAPNVETAKECVVEHGEFDWMHVVHPESLEILFKGALTTKVCMETETYTHFWEWSDGSRTTEK